MKSETHLAPHIGQQRPRVISVITSNTVTDRPRTLTRLLVLPNQNFFLRHGKPDTETSIFAEWLFRGLWNTQSDTGLALCIAKSAVNKNGTHEVTLPETAQFVTVTKLNPG